MVELYNFLLKLEKFLKENNTEWYYLEIVQFDKTGATFKLLARKKAADRRKKL